MKRWWPEILVLVLEAAVLVAFYYLTAPREGVTQESSFDLFLPAMLTMIFLLIVYSGLRMTLLTRSVDQVAQEARTAVGEMDELSSLLLKSTNSLALYRQEDFYDSFPKVLRKAQHAVALSHFDSRSPLDTATPAAREYYAVLPQIVRLNNATSFRRLERFTHGKIAWLLQLCEEYQGLVNFSLAYLPFGGKERERTPAISVQVIDNQRTYLVAIARHEDLHEFRDICLVGEAPARIWHTYFEDLWTNSRLLIDKGRVSEELRSEITAANS